MARQEIDGASKQPTDKARVALASAFLIGAAIVAQPASAQINPAQQTVRPMASNSDDGPVRSGARVPGVAGFNGRGLAVTASVSNRYETNFSRLPAIDDAVRFLPQVSASYGLGSKRLGLFVDGSYGRDIVLGNQLIKGGDRSSLSGGLDFVLSRCSGQLGGSFRKSLNLRTDAGLFGGFQQQTETLGTAANCQIGNALSVNGAISKSKDKNVAGASFALNTDRLDYSAGLGFNASGLGQFSLGGAISDVHFPGRFVVSPNGIVEDSFKQRSLRVGVSRAFGNRITATLGASAIDNKPGTESTVIIVDGLPQIVDRAGFSGVGYDGALAVTLSSRLAFEVSADRTVNSNPFVGALLTISNSYAASANAKLGQYTVTAGGLFSRNRYQGGFVSQFDPAARRSDRFESYFINVGGKIGQRLRASVEVNHVKRISNPDLFSFTSTGAGLNLSVAFGRGSR
jgi:hypothetical protein